VPFFLGPLDPSRCRHHIPYSVGSHKSSNGASHARQLQHSRKMESHAVLAHHAHKSLPFTGSDDIRFACKPPLFSEL